MSRCTLDSAMSSFLSLTGLSPSLAGFPKTFLLGSTNQLCGPNPTVHAPWFGLFPFRSPLLWKSIFLSAFRHFLSSTFSSDICCRMQCRQLAIILHILILYHLPAVKTSLYPNGTQACVHHNINPHHHLLLQQIPDVFLLSHHSQDIHHML